MYEIVFIIGSRMYSYYGDKRKGDSLVKEYLHELANSGYPFAIADIFVDNGQYLAIIRKNRFYILREPKIVGDYRAQNVIWLIKESLSRPFQYDRIMSGNAVANYYGISMDIYRQSDDIILKFRKLRTSSIGMALNGSSRGIYGYGDIFLFNLFGYPMRMNLVSQFDTSNFYISGNLDIPENQSVPFGVFAGADMIDDNNALFYYVGLHKWHRKNDLGIGFGEYMGVFSVMRFISIRSFFAEILLFIAREDMGLRFDLKYGLFKVKGFKGINGLKDSYGGFDGFREVDKLGSLSDNYLIIKADIPVYKANFSVGPFSDVLFIRKERPNISYGLFFQIGEVFHMFISQSRRVGFMLRYNCC